MWLFLANMRRISGFWLWSHCVCLKSCKMEETRSAVLKRRISELEAKNERLEQDNKKLKQECECYEVKQLKQGMEELHAALKPRFFLWFSGRNKNNVYDEKGILISCGKDVCDCMDDSCPGCHFPCPKCRSNKCGNECRQNRKWMFESVELDGNPNSVKYNPYAKDLQIPPTKNRWSWKHDWNYCKMQQCFILESWITDYLLLKLSETDVDVEENIRHLSFDWHKVFFAMLYPKFSSNVKKIFDTCL